MSEPTILIRNQLAIAGATLVDIDRDTVAERYAVAVAENANDYVEFVPNRTYEATVTVVEMRKPYRESPTVGYALEFLNTEELADILYCEKTIRTALHRCLDQALYQFKVIPSKNYALTIDISELSSEEGEGS